MSDSKISTITSKLLSNVSGTDEFCIKYAESQVTDWDTQTGTSLSGYSPNPSSFTVAFFKCAGTYVSLFNDIIKEGKC